jgi:hypothetical protein
MDYDIGASPAEEKTMTLRPRHLRRPRLLRLRASAFSALLIASLALPLAGASMTGGSQSSQAVELNERGKELLAEGRHEAAIEEFDQAIAADETFWEAWYQRGRALALLSRFDEAVESLLHSTVLNPGHANAHMLTCHAAMYAENFELAWDQGIRAYLAGEDPQAIFGGLSSRSEPPPDFDERIAAWRVYVAGVDTTELIASAQNPNNTRGGASGIQEDLVQIQPELLALQQQVAAALSDSRGFGLVADAELAQYYVTISPEEIEAAPRPRMSGYLRLYGVDSDNPLYFRPIAFRDLSAAGQVKATLQNVINQMETWRREQLQAQ